MTMTDQDRAFARFRFCLWSVIDGALLFAISAIGMTLLGLLGLWRFEDPPRPGESILSGPMLAWLAGADALRCHTVDGLAALSPIQAPISERLKV